MRMLSLLTDSSLVGPSPLDSVHYAKVGRSKARWVLRDGQGCPKEHWDKTLMLTITGQ